MLKKLSSLLHQRLYRARLRRLEKQRASVPDDRRRVVLLWAPGGMSLMLDVEGGITKALELRGHKVHAVICDGTARACVRREVGINPDMATWSKECAACRKSSERKLQDFNLPYTFIGDHVSAEELAALREVAGRVT